MPIADFRHLEPLRVRWAEIDAQNIVFNAHYLTYVDVAMSGYWRALAFPYAASMQSLGGDLYVRKATLDYHGSARMDDRLMVGIRCSRIGNSSMLFHAEVLRGAERLVAVELVYVFADPATQTSRPVPERLRAVVEGFEAGQPMLDVSVGPWSERRAEASALRDEVFVAEQGVPVELEHDDADATALHALARNRLGAALATGRLVHHAPGVSKIGRMAVVRSMRGTGIGRAVLDALIATAAARGDSEVLLHAQVDAIDFYTRAGFVLRGECFTEAGIAHQAMVRPLAPAAPGST
jgi:YbgC/YbaW family acyl-CoA thioester hydrolase